MPGADDTFRLDLADQDREFILETFDGFFEDAGHYGRRLIEIRMCEAMLDKLGLKDAGPSFRAVPITVADTGFVDTVEVILAPSH